MSDATVLEGIGDYKYGFSDPDTYVFKSSKGLSKETVEQTRAAIHFERGEIALNEAFVVESILGTTFGGRVASVTKVGPHSAVIPEVTGSAHITGRHEFLLDPEDPLLRGFLLR